jgi:hypothetical protein
VCQAALAVTRKKNCYLSAQFRTARREVKGAVMAFAHTHELGGNYLERIDEDRRQRYFVKPLQRLGLKVTVETVPEAA